MTSAPQRTGESTSEQVTSGKRRRPWGRDLLAGLVDAVVALPDGLATAALVGVNPISGLYANASGPMVGGAMTSSQLMIVATTSASAVTAAELLSGFAPGEKPGALMTLVVLTGGFLLLFGLLRAGRLVRFVSHAVMTGFMLGVAVTLVLSQLPDLVGYHPQEPGWLASHTAIVGLSALTILLILKGTRLSLWAPILALVLPTALSMMLGWKDVLTVGQQSEIPRGFPMPRSLTLDYLTFELIASSFAIAVVVAIQAAGVSQSMASRQGRPSNVSRDMIAQGVANFASGVMSGIVVGGSVGQTALNVSVGAVTRWASISAGLWLLVFLFLAPNLVGLAPTSALAALMVGAGFGAMNWREARSIWGVGGGARVAIVVTFAACLFLSIPAAVGLGVAVTMIFFVMSSATDVSIRMLVRRPDGQVEEQKPPSRLASHEVLVLDVWGSLFFAGARTLEEALPDPADAQAPAVILRMRGHNAVDATLIKILDDYAQRLSVQGGALYLSGVSDQLAGQLKRSGKLVPSSNVHIVRFNSIIGVATKEAITQANQWVADSSHQSLE